MADAIASFAPITGVAPPVRTAEFDDAAARIAGTNAAATPTNVDTPGFAAVLDQIEAVEDNANAAAVDLATGKLANPHEFTALASQARLTVELTAAVRNRAVESFTEVMRMQI